MEGGYIWKMITILLHVVIPVTFAQPEWRAGGWYSRCSETCGGGVQYRSTRCSTKDSKTLPDERCAHLGAPPSNFQACNRQDCPPQIFRYPYSACEDCFRNRTLECRIRSEGGYNRVVPLTMCGLQSNIERDVCRHGPGCWVVWKTFSYPCCHPKAAQGYACVNEHNKLIPDWVCEKMTHVAGLVIPQPAPCEIQTTCEPPTLPPTTPPPPVTTAPPVRGPAIEDTDPEEATTKPRVVAVGDGNYSLIPKDPKSANPLKADADTDNSTVHHSTSKATVVMATPHAWLSLLAFAVVAVTTLLL